MVEKEDVEYAKGLVDQAHTHLQTARTCLKNFDYPECVQAAQKCVELCVKAALKALTGDFPRRHHVADELAKYVDKLPEHVKRKLPRIAFASWQLNLWRSPSTYGYDLPQVPPDKLFGKEEAELAVSYAEGAYFAINPFVSSLWSESLRGKTS